MTRWGSMWLASQVEWEREPPTSQNDLLGVVGAGVAGGNSPGELLVVLCRARQGRVLEGQGLPKLEPEPQALPCLMPEAWPEGTLVQKCKLLNSRGLMN